MDDLVKADFVWPEPTDQQLTALWNRPGTGYVEDMRDAIALDRWLLATHAQKIRAAWQDSPHDSTWLLTRGFTVKPLRPTLAEAREAARLLAGPAAEIVTRYLESQEGQADG